jgi:predicted metal-dependent hydrolase
MNPLNKIEKSMPEYIAAASEFLPGMPDGWDIVIREGHRNAYRIRVLPEGILEVTAPCGADIVPYLHHHEAWIKQQVEETVRIAKEGGANEDFFLLDGTYRTLTHGTTCEIGDRKVVYDSPIRFKEMLMSRLQSDVNERVNRGIPRIGRSPNRITIRMQRSRWASCSGRGNLNFNLTMLALSPSLREYIVLHELVHLVVPNHSPGFWRLLEEFCPDCQHQKQELKRYHVLVKRNRVWNVLRTIP